MHRHKDWPEERGFAYLALLITIAILGALAAGSLSAGATLQRRLAEQELLVIGLQFQQAFQSYRNATPIGQPPFPERLEDLVRDKRGPAIKRHLRKIYADPLTGRFDWGVISAPGGRVAGVFSRADGQPIKVTQFPAELVDLENRARYSEWIFGDRPATEKNKSSGILGQE